MRKEIKRLSIFLFLSFLLFAMADISEANFQGTIGTRVTITDSGFGTKKPQVYIQYEKKPGVVKKVYAKVELWSDTSITCLWTETLSAGTYNLWVKPNIAKTNSIAEGTFTIMPPSIDEVTPDILTPGATITINGEFFTNKKPTVYLQDLVSLKKKSCRVLISTMDPATGTSSLNFVVPKWGSGNYEIILQTLIGKASSNPLLANWHWRNPLPQVNTLNSVSYGNGTFVAVGNDILTSPDGVTWTLRNSGTDASLRGVTYGNGAFIAVGDNGTILTSPNGVTWTLRNSGTDMSLHGVAHGNGTFIAVGDNGTILTSPNGVTWTLRNSGTDVSLQGVTYGNGTFVAVGYSGISLTSLNGVTWTASVYSIFSLGIHIRYPMWRYFSGVTYGDGAFVTVGGVYTLSGSSYLLFTSPDGVTWTCRNSGIGDLLYGVTYGNGIFVAVGQSGTIFTSPNGVTWTSINSGTDSSLLGVTYGNGTFVAVGASGAILQSDPIE
jgi:hypothetical protein